MKSTDLPKKSFIKHLTLIFALIIGISMNLSNFIFLNLLNPKVVPPARRRTDNTGSGTT